MSDETEDVVVRIPKAMADALRAQSPGQDLGRLLFGMVVGFETLRKWMNDNRDTIEVVRGGEDLFTVLSRLLAEARKEKAN